MLDRRRFLQSATLALTARGALAATEPNIQFPAGRRERLAVASYPFRAFIDSPHNRDRNRNKPPIELKNFAHLVVERFNVRGIEPLGEHFPSTDAAWLARFREANEKAGAHVVNIPTNVDASLYDPDAARRSLGVTNGKKWIDAAVALASPSVRLHIQGARGVSPDVDRAAESLKAIAEYGAEKNVVVNLENDDPATEDAFYIVKVIEKVNSPWLRALPDFCNSMLKGDEKFNYDAVTAMFRHAYNISHVKDSEWDNGREYRVDIVRTFGIAKAAGYRGFFSMEFEGKGDPWEGTRKLIEESLKDLA